MSFLSFLESLDIIATAATHSNSAIRKSVSLKPRWQSLTHRRPDTIIALPSGQPEEAVGDIRDAWGRGGHCQPLE